MRVYSGNVLNYTAMQMQLSITLAAYNDDFENADIPAPAAKTLRQEKTGTGKGKGRKPSA